MRDKIDRVKYNKITYLKLIDLNKRVLSDDMLPFVKRHPFEPENEIRIIFLSNIEQK